MQWNILNYGRLINAVHAQDAKFQAAVYQYQQTALTAQREVEDSLVGFLQAQQQAASLQQGVAETARSVDLVKEQFENGLTDFDRVYNTESLLVTQQDQLAQSRGNIAVNLIGVYRALGGGWQCFCGNCGPPGGVAVSAARRQSLRSIQPGRQRMCLYRFPASRSRLVVVPILERKSSRCRRSTKCPRTEIFCPSIGERWSGTRIDFIA